MTIEKITFPCDDLGPYLDLLGAIIRQALDDYAHINPENRANGVYHSTAENYLFSPRGLEDFLKRTGADQMLNIGFIRKSALAMRAGKAGFLHEHLIKEIPEE